MSSLIKRAMALAKKGQENESAPVVSKTSPLVAFSLAMVIENDGKSTAEEALKSLVDAGERGRDYDGAFVLVHEKKDRGWWVAGGGVDLGESLAEGCIRETLEEAGVRVECIGIIHAVYGFGRIDAAFLCRPLEPGRAPLKTVADNESKGAHWVTNAEMLAIKNADFDVEDCKLRGNEPVEFVRRLGQGQIWPMDFIITRKCVTGEGSIANGGPPIVTPKSRAVFDTTVAIRAIILNDQGQVAADGARRLYCHYPWSKEEMHYMLDCEIKNFTTKLKEKLGVSEPSTSLVVLMNKLHKNESELDAYVALHVSASEAKAVALPMGFQWIAPSKLIDENDRDATTRAIQMRVTPFAHSFLSR